MTADPRHKDSLLYPTGHREKCEELAREIVDSWDMNTLCQWAVEQMADSFELNRESSLIGCLFFFG